MKKRTSNLSRRIVSLLMSMVLTLTLVTPAAFATEVVDGSGTAIVEDNTNPADVNTSGDNEGKDDENKDTEHGGDEQPTNPGDEDKNPGEGEDDVNASSNEADTQEGEGTDTPVVAQRTVTLEKWNKNAAYDVKIVIPAATSEPGEGETTEAPGEGENAGSGNETLSTEYTGTDEKITLKLTTEDYTDNPIIYIKSSADEVVAETTPKLGDDGTLEYVFTGEETDITLYYGTKDDFVSAWYGDGSATKYTIRSAEELAYLATLVNGGNDFSGKTVTLARDIDLSGIKDWTSIGVEGHPFKGKFAGGQGVTSNDELDCHKVFGLNGDLFGVVDSGKNKTAIQYVTISGGTGRLVNELKSGKVENCMSTAKVDSSDENPAAGGLVGTAVEGATVSSSYYYNKDSINVPAVGGSGTVTNCFYLAETSTFDKKGTADDTGARTAEEFAAGRVTWGLNGSEKTLKNPKNYWGQKDALPYLVLNKPVYELTLTAKSVVPEGMSVTLSKDGQPALKNGNTQYLYYPSGDNTGIKVTEAGITKDYTVTYSPKNPEEANLSFIMDISALTFYYSIVKTIEPDTEWYDSKKDTFVLYNAAELFGFAKLVIDGDLYTGTVTLGADIDLTGYDWTPVDFIDNGYQYGFAYMTFDGQGHKITGLNINTAGDKYVGLFAFVGDEGVVQNLQVEGNITAEYPMQGYELDGGVGGIAGCIDKGTVKNCLSNVAIEATGTGWLGIGGVAGIAQSGSTIDLCWNEGNVTGNINDENSYAGVGGIVGAGDITVTNSANFGTISCSDAGSTGGIMGTFSTSSGQVINSYNLGDVIGSTCGGVAGDSGSITVKNSYYICKLGDASAQQYINGNTTMEITVAEDAEEQKTVYTVGTNAEALVDVLNRNKGANLGWLNKHDKPFNPVHIYKWNGELEPGVPGTATLIYHPNGATSGTKQTETLRVGENESEATFTIKTDVALGFKHENGTFLGWSEDSKAATPTYKFDASKGTFTLAKISVDKDETVTLYAVWENIWTGSGTEAAPYEISSKDELTALATQVNDKGFSYAGKRFKLTADIALNGDEWTPIGKGPKNCFEGSLIGDGDDGKTISGLCITGGRDAAGLFGYVKNSQSSSQFDKLTLKDVNITNRGNCTGGLIGSVQGLKSIPLSHITVSGTISGGKYTGGILGNGYAEATECTVSGSVSGDGMVGGLVAGSSGDTYGTFIDCVNRANVSSTATYGGSAAGIQACSVSNPMNSFTGCINSGTIIASGADSHAAGIANGARKIENCQNSGAISAVSHACGIGNGVNIEKCSNTGFVNGGVAAGIATGYVLRISFCSNTGAIEATAGGVSAKRAYGIFAATNTIKCTIKYSFSYVAGKDIALAPNTLAKGKVTNSYYLASSATAVSSAGEYATLADFASGKVAWGVDGGTDAHKNYWTQGKDDYPIPIGEGTSTSYYRAQATCGTGGTVTIKRGDGRTGDADNAVYGPSGTKVTVTATPKDSSFALKSLTLDLMGTGTTSDHLANPGSFTLGAANAKVVATFASAGSGGGSGSGSGSGDGTGTGDKDDEGLQDGLNMDVEYDIKGLVLGAYAEWGSNGGNKSFQKWLEENPNVVRALLTNSLDNMATAAVGKKTDEAKDLAALLLASLNEHTGVDGKNGDTIAKALQKYIDSGSEEVFSAWLTGGGGMASGTYESIYGQYASSLAALADRLYSKWEASGTSMTFPVWLDSQQVTMESLSENAEEPDAEPDDTQTTEAPEDVPDGQDTEGGASGNSVWEVIGTVVRENPILVWSIVAVIAALIIVGAVRRYHKVKRDEHDEK